MSGTVQAINEIYLRNMGALWRADGRLAQRIDDLPDETDVSVEPSKSGPPTVVVSSAQGTRRYLHSRHDPEAEACKLADHVDLGENLCFVVGGFGLGYHVKSLYERLKGDAFLIVSEPSLPLLRAALETVDHSDMIREGKCLFLTTADKAELQDKLRPFNTAIMMGTRFVVHPPSEQLNGEFHKTIRALLADHMAYCKTSLLTLVGNSRVTCTNVANNLPTYVATPPIDVLRDRFRGNPAVVVSAGPSLQRNVDLLRNVRDRIVIISVQTTFKPLIRRGIVPHFVTSLDYAEISRRFFQEVEGGLDVHLVAEPKVAWQVPDEFEGPISILHNEFAARCIGPALARRGGLKAGATVAHLAFYLAQYMGCSPIVFIGQDLGFTHGVFYAPGAEIHDSWRPELNRFCSIEMKEWERIARRRPILRRAKDIHGNDIYTDEMLFTYLQQFEGDFATSPAQVIDATEGGVRKAYTETMSLAEALARFAGEPIPPDRFDYLRGWKRFDPARLPPAREALARRLGEIDAVADLCRETLEVLREMTDLTGNPAAFNRKIIRLDRLRTRVYQNDQILMMMSGVSQAAELRRFAADRKLGMDDVRGGERARRQLQRDIAFVDALLDGAEFLKKILQGALDRFDAKIQQMGAP